METPIIFWVLIAVSFCTYFIISLVYKRLGVTNLENALLVTNGLRFINLKHVLGIVLFGVIFYVIFPDLRSLILTIKIPRLHVLLLLLLAIFLSVYLSDLAVQKYKIQNASSSSYCFSSAWVYFAIRFVFLFCYEFFFRGVLLYKFLEFNSLFMAVTFSTILYVLIHIFDSKKEILGAIPFGVVLCLLTYFTHGIWAAFFVHLALSAVYEISVFYHLTIKNKTL